MKLYVHTIFEPSAKKTPSLLFMLRKNQWSILVKSIINRSFHFRVWRRYASSIIILCLGTASSKQSSKINVEPPSYVIDAIWCMMLCYAMQMMWWCDVMQNDICRRSMFIFYCKPPLGASSPFTSTESAFIFRCKLCIPFGTTFEQKTYAALP